MDIDDFPIRVTVAPSQSAYFAGEPFSVKITFTNTAKCDALSSSKLSSPSTPTKTHRRASHSISSAPIAKPPTSPAGHTAPRTSSSLASSKLNRISGFKDKEEPERPMRRGLVGQTRPKESGRETEGLLDVVEQRRRKMLSRSMSLSLQTNGLTDDGERGEDLGVYGTVQSSPSSPLAPRSLTSPSSPKVASPLSRSETLPLAASHPHARKNSYMDGQQSIHVNPPLGIFPVNEHNSVLSPSSPSNPSPLRNNITAPPLPNKVNSPFLPFDGPPSASSSSASLVSYSSVDSGTSFNSVNSIHSAASTNNVTAYPIPSTPSVSALSFALDPIAENISPGSESTPLKSNDPTSIHVSHPTPSLPHRSSSPHSPHRLQPAISIQEATPVKQPAAKDANDGGTYSAQSQTDQSPVSPTNSRRHGRTKSYSHAAHRPNSGIDGLGIGYPSQASSSIAHGFPHNGAAGLNHDQTEREQNRGHDGEQLILYSYTQLKGSVVLTPLPSPSGSRSRSVSSSVSSRTPSTASTGTSNSVNPYSPNPTSSGTKYGPTPLPPPFPTSGSSFSSQSPHVAHVTDVQLTPAQVLALLRTSLLKSSAGAVGGGSMDIGRMTSSLGSNSSLSLLSRQGPKSNLGGGRGHTRSSLSIDVGNANASLNLGSAMSSDTPSSGTRPPHKRSSSIGMGMGLLNALLGPSSPALDPADNKNGYSSPMHASRSAPDVSNPGRPSGVAGNSVYNPISGRTPAEGRSRAVSASASASSLTGGYSGGSFGSIGSLGAWLTGSSPNPSSSFLSGVGLGGGVGKEIDAETPLPTFEVPPAMLAVDMVLKPGEERSYTYTLLLPPDLPPTFRGRTFRFSYELVIGIGVRRSSGSISNPSKSTGLGLGIAGISDSSGQERILSSSSTSASHSSNARGSGPGPGPSGGSTSKIMQIPIRVYTNVVVGRSPSPYDLLWPVYKRQQQGFAPGHRRGGRGVASSPLAVTKYKKSGSNKDMYTGKVEEITRGNDRMNQREMDGDGTERILDKDRDKDKGLDELREYAKGLVDATTTISRRSGDSEADEEDQTITMNRHLGQNPPVIMNGHNKDNLGFGPSESVAASGNGKVGIGCGEAVEILTRNQKKVSYDVNKDGVKVAVLTFTKAAYRLGETVQGVVELNERTSRARVVQLSAHLETHESLPTALTSPPSSGSPAARELKRVHAEHYSSFVLSTMRTTFSLDIPSDASAAFQIKVGNEKATGHGSSRDPFGHSPQTQGRAYSAHGTSNAATGTTVSTPGFPSFSSTSLYPHSPLPNTPMMPTVPASAPAYPSTFPLSSPLPPPSSPWLPSPSLSPSTPIPFPIPPNSQPGGLEWKVKLCLLVAIASEGSDLGTEGVRVKGLVRDDEVDERDGAGGDEGHEGRRGEWGSSWKAVGGIGLEKVAVGASRDRLGGNGGSGRSGTGVGTGAQNHNQNQGQGQGMVKSWASFLASSILGTGDEVEGGGEDEDENDGYDEEDEAEMNGWIDPPMYDGIKPDRAGGVGVGVEYGNEGKWLTGPADDISSSPASPDVTTVGDQEQSGNTNESKVGGRTKIKNGGRRKRKIRAEWRELRVETVECEVPIRVWPGNTAYKPVDVVFDV